jgi:hypothetical protein
MKRNKMQQFFVRLILICLLTLSLAAVVTTSPNVLIRFNRHRKNFRENGSPISPAKIRTKFNSRPFTGRRAAV